MSKHKHECNRVLVLDTAFQDPDNEEDPDEDDDEEEEPDVRLAIVYWVYDRETKKATNINYIPRVSWATTGVNYGGRNNKKEYVSLKVTFIHDQTTQCSINFDKRNIVSKPTKTVLKWITNKFQTNSFGNNQDDHKT